jgi:hypothetical protein
VTDIIIPNDSCHPREHKTAAIRYYNRMNTYNLTPENKQKEKDTLLSNKYDDAIEKPYKDKAQKQDNRKCKWAKFTYIGKETRFITKLSKDTNVNIAFTTNNSLQLRNA